jgi:ATP-dependent helicase HrpA
VRDLGWRWAESLPVTIDLARYATIHQALLAGLLSNVGRKVDAEENYLGARGIKFFLHPGSGLAKHAPPWVLAAELTETTRLYARCAARIEPEWVEAVAGDLVEKTHFDPHWDPARGEVVASERVTLFGLPLVARRRISYGAVAPAAAREVFLREALVAGGLDSPAPFFAHNRGLIAEVAELEHKSRRQDVLVDEETIYAFYAERVGECISTRVGFERWRRAAEAEDPQRLFLTRELLMRHAAAAITPELFPEFLELAGTRLALKYRFAPGHPDDGLTLTVPLALLNQLDAARLSWLVPGMVREKVTWYLKALPRLWRNRLLPLPEVVTAFLEHSERTAGGLRETLRAFIAERLGSALPAEVWGAPPPHLRFELRVVDAAGHELATGRDLAALRAQLGEAAQLDFAAAQPALERKGIRTWDFGDLPESLSIERDGRRLTGYPALVREGDAVALTLLDTREAADAATRAATIALLRIPLKDALRRWEKGGPGFVPAALALKNALPTERLLADVLAAVSDRALLGEDPLPRSERAFAAQLQRARVRLPAVAEGAFALLGAIATAYHGLTQRLSALPPAQGRLAADVAAQRDRLVGPGFFVATPWNQLVHLPRYLQALDRRLAKYPENPARDAKHAQAVAALWDRYRERDQALRARGRQDPGLEAFRWLLEELKVSLYAQELRTPFPVSYKRLEKAWKALAGG